MRLFVSVDLPDDFAEAIADVQSELDDASGLSMTDPAQAHVTLKFLGEVDESSVEEVLEWLRAGVADAAVEPFECSVAGLGVFPEPEYISVVWLGIEQGGKSLTRLHESIESRAVDDGFEPEEHSFRPHVTIGRMNHGGGKQHVRTIVENQHPEIGTFSVESVSLTASTLRSDGPVYSTVETVALSGADTR